MARFTMKDFSKELMFETAACETPAEVKKLFASKGFDLSDRTSEKFFAFTRETELEDEALLTIAGGSCSDGSSTGCDE